MTIAHRVRAILRRSTPPLPVSILAERLGERQQAVTNALCRMPDAYVASWSVNFQNKYVREWTVTRTPPHAPKPTHVKTKTSS